MITHHCDFSEASFFLWVFFSTFLLLKSYSSFNSNPRCHLLVPVEEGPVFRIIPCLHISYSSYYTLSFTRAGTDFLCHSDYHAGAGMGVGLGRVEVVDAPEKGGYTRIAAGPGLRLFKVAY